MKEHADLSLSLKFRNSNLIRGCLRDSGLSFIPEWTQSVSVKKPFICSHDSRMRCNSFRNEFIPVLILDWNVVLALCKGGASFITDWKIIGRNKQSKLIDQLHKFLLSHFPFFYASLWPYRLSSFPALKTVFRRRIVGLLANVCLVLCCIK